MTPHPEDGDHNRDLHDVIDLLEQEIDRLKAVLEVFELNDSPAARRQADRHSRSIAERESRLEDLRQLVASAAGPESDDAH